MCDECQGQRCGGKFAPFFCANVTCLQVYFTTIGTFLLINSEESYKVKVGFYYQLI